MNPPARPPRTNGLSLYFAIALGGTWSLQLPAVLAQRGLLPGDVQRYWVPAFLGGFCPLLGALLATRAERNIAAVPEQTASLWRMRAPFYWHVFAFALFPSLYVLGAGMYRWLANDHTIAWLYLPTTPQHVFAMFVVPIAEEPGWRGFALPRLQVRYGAFTASFVLGLVWAAWHWMMLLLQSPSLSGFAIATANIVAASFVFTWLYTRTRGDLLVAILAHAGAHFSNPARAPAGQLTPLLVYTGAIVAVVALLVVFDRPAWRTRWRRET